MQALNELEARALSVRAFLRGDGGGGGARDAAAPGAADELVALADEMIALADRARAATADDAASTSTARLIEAREAFERRIASVVPATSPPPRANAPRIEEVD